MSNKWSTYEKIVTLFDTAEHAEAAETEPSARRLFWQ